MKDLSIAIKKVSDSHTELRKEIIQEMTNFIKKYGKPVPKQKNTYLLRIDSSTRNSADITCILVECDRHSETFCYSEIDSFTLINDHDIRVSTEYGDTYLAWLPVADLVDLYESLSDIDNGEYDDIEIIDGVIQEKEEDDE